MQSYLLIPVLETGKFFIFLVAEGEARLRKNKRGRGFGARESTKDIKFGSRRMTLKSPHVVCIYLQRLLDGMDSSHALRAR